ncbi:hypothetical protein [Streptomyces sp. NPDC048659]|uniref:hypothetical protein n=1 Tax=Streptomyces sp. NPDC048659 TaxID=3155489 RepID=UPI003418ABCF
MNDGDEQLLRPPTSTAYVWCGSGPGLGSSWSRPYTRPSRRIREQDAWAKELFPTMHERLEQAAETPPPDSLNRPFADALTELVHAQADTAGFVVLHRWAEILERRFPLQLPDPEHTTE